MNCTGKASNCQNAGHIDPAIRVWGVLAALRHYSATLKQAGNPTQDPTSHPTLGAQQLDWMEGSSGSPTPRSPGQTQGHCYLNRVATTAAWD